MKTIEAGLAAVLNGATAQIAAAIGKVPLGDANGKIGDDWLNTPIRGIISAHGVIATTLATATEGAITLDTTDIDTISGSLVANEVTVPANVTIAVVSGQVAFAASTATANRIYAGISLDGVIDATTTHEIQKSSAVSVSPYVMPQGIISVSTGQSIGVMAYQDSGANWATANVALSVTFY